MGAFTAVTWVRDINHGSNGKTAVFTATCPASYDANGSTIDLSEATIGSGHGFMEVFQVTVSRPIAGATAGAGFDGVYIPAAAYDAATGKIIMSNIWQATPAEASGDLSTTPGSLLLVVTGR